MAYKDIKISDLEEEYSPSRWSHRGSAQEVLQSHVDYVSKVSQETRDAIPCEVDISFGVGPRQKVDIFGIHLPSDAPWFIYIHGGYWQELSRELSSYPVKPLVEAGVRVAIAGYDLCPDVSLTDIVSQSKKMALFCLDTAYQMSAKSVTFCGHSAGAHIAAMILTEEFMSSLPDHLQQIISGVCLISGVFDIAPLLHTTINNKLNLTNLEVMTMSPILQKYNSEIRKNIKIIIAVGQYDSNAFKSQSEAFSKVLRKSFVEVDYEVIADCDHFNIVENLNSSDYNLTKLILKKLISYD